MLSHGRWRQHGTSGGSVRGRRVSGTAPRRTATSALVALGIAAVVLLAVGGATVMRAGEPDAALTVMVATATPTPTPSPAPTEEPTPVPWPIPAARIPLGEAAGLSNPMSADFPAPALDEAVSEPNEARVVRIVAPSLDIDHHIITLGVTNGGMDAPPSSDAHAVGWYLPGSGGFDFGVPGDADNSVFAAHESWSKERGPFYRLHEARTGEEIYLDMADGERRIYQVASVTRYTLAEIPMSEVLWPSDRPKHEEWLTLYTCGGEIIYGGNGFGDYLARDVLVAKWVGSTRTPVADASAAAID